MRTVLAYAVLGAALVGCARAQSPDPIELADGRRGDAPWPDLSTWDGHPLLQQATAAARAHWQGQDPDYEEEMRLLAVAGGAFTQPGAQQHAVLYLMSLWPRCCPKMGLAIIEGDRLVQNVAFEGVAQELSAVPDLDGDGRDELAFLGAFGMGGQMSGTLTLASFGEHGLTDWGSIPLYDNACAAGHDGATAARVLAHPGPEFQVEWYTQASCESETWEASSEAEPLALEAPTESRYISLAVE